MYEFADRLINLALPRVRDFRGVNPNAFDGRGNYALGIKEQLIFPEIEYDKVDKVRGMDVIFVTYEQTFDPETDKNVFNYLTDLRVIDLSKFELSETLTVAANPNQVLAEDGKIFLISWGNYNDQGYEFQMIDPKQNNKVTSLGVASKMGVGNDKVYLVYALTDWTTRVTTNTFSYYDIKAGKMVNSSFINDHLKQLENASIFSIGVNDENGDIYIGLTNYTTSNGSFFRFKKDGSMLYDFANCGGQNPSKFVFIDAD